MELNNKFKIHILIFLILLNNTIFSQQLFYKNFELIDKDGNIKTDIIVGHNASISDVLAAIKLQNFLISNSYKKINVSAKLVSLPKVSCNYDFIKDYGVYFINNSSAEFEIENYFRNTTYFVLMKNDYLDSIVGNGILDVTSEIKSPYDYMHGYLITERELGLLAKNNIRAKDSNIIQSNRIYLIAYKSPSYNDKLRLDRLTYEIEFSKKDEQFSGLQKCFPTFREDYYFAYCSITNDPLNFIGNLNLSLDILGKKYLILDMAIPLINNLTKLNDTFFGGKLVLGENQSLLKVNSGNKLEIGNQSYQFYVFDKWVDVKSNSENTIITFEKYFLLKVGNKYLKLIDISNKTATFFVYDNIHILTNNGTFMKFKVFLEWVNNGPERYRFYEPSRRPDALKRIILVDIRNESLESGNEIYENTGIYLFKIGEIHDYFNITISNNLSKSLDYYDEECHKNTAKGYFTITIHNNANVQNLYFSPNLMAFGVKENLSYRNISCRGVLLINTTSIELRIDNSNNKFFISYDKSNQSNARYLSLKIFNLSGSMIEELQVISNLTLNSFSQTNYGTQLIEYSQNQIFLQVPLDAQRYIYGIYYSKPIFTVREVVVKNNSYLVLNPNNPVTIYSVKLRFSPQQCLLQKSKINCKYDENSLFAVLTTNSSMNNYSNAIRNQIIYVQKDLNDRPLIYLDLHYNNITKTNKRNLKIVIGGYYVNSFAKDLQNLTQNQSITKVIGDRIIIAGYSKEDTLKEVDKFISILNSSLYSH
ncbi:MAG: hypothetical protein QXF76_00695 [Candidatus Anstonellales archaeon]